MSFTVLLIPAILAELGGTPGKTPLMLGVKPDSLWVFPLFLVLAGQR